MEELVKYLGNFHPVILHLPIARRAFAPAAAALASNGRSDASRRSARAAEW